MTEVVCVIGTKGGTGKTTLSHMLCHGLALLGRRAACVMTDEYREPLRHGNRRYLMADARSLEARQQIVSKLRDLKGWFGVLDGGANRTETDISLYALSDLVLLPFRDSAEDIRTVMHDLELFPRALALPCQWPRNQWQKDAADRLMASIPDEFHSRILPPFYAISASKLLLLSEPPDQLPVTLNRAARELAERILHMIVSDEADAANALGGDGPAPPKAIC